MPTINQVNLEGTVYDISDSSFEEYKTTVAPLKADKDTDAVEGNIAIFDANGNPVDSNISNTNVALKNGYYEEMVVGSADKLVEPETVTVELANITINNIEGLAKINDVRGNSLVWNQLVQNGNFADGATGWYAGYYAGKNTLSVGNNVATITKTASTTVVEISSGAFELIAGHKYVISYDARVNETCNFVFGVISNTIPSGAANVWAKHTAFYTADSNRKRLYFGAVTANNADTVLELRNIITIDLTLMFGAGNEPSTVEEFEALFPQPYYAYNAGEIISNKTEQVKAVGFNQWDEEWEVGNIDATTGQNSTSTTQIRSKNYCPMLPNTAYYYGIPNISGGSYMGFVYYYDANKNYISRTAVGPSNLSIVTSDANAHYYRIIIRAEYGTTYNHDICINLSDPAKNGTYEPYKTNTIELNLPTLTGKVNGEGESVIIAADGLKSAGSVYDEGIVENGYLTKIVKRIGVVDMGTLNYTKYDVTQGTLFRAAVSGIVAGVGASSIPNLICSRYVTTASNGRTEKTISVIPSSHDIDVIDSAYTDAATFKTAMSGVMSYYELAEPVTYVLDTPIPATFQSYKGGTLKQIPENGSVPTTAPISISYKEMLYKDIYAMNIAYVNNYTDLNYIRKDNIVQTSGQSTTNIMSQKAIYDLVLGSMDLSY